MGNIAAKIQTLGVPKSYNPRVHGPFVPDRYYGEPYQPLMEVKLGNLWTYMKSRTISPSATSRLIQRKFYGYRKLWVRSRNSGLVGYIQVVNFIIAFHAARQYYNLRKYDPVKYH